MQQQGATQEDARLFFRAACCLISADGKVSNQELGLLSEAMNRLGFPHTPEQLRGLATSTCKEIHSKGVDSESDALAGQLRRFSGMPLASYLQQVLASLAESDGVVAAREQLIISRFCAALVPSAPKTPPPLQATARTVSTRSAPISVASQPAYRPVTPGSAVRPLNWKWIFPILAVIYAIVRVRMAFSPAASKPTPRPTSSDTVPTQQPLQANAQTARRTKVGSTPAAAKPVTQNSVSYLMGKTLGGEYVERYRRRKKQEKPSDDEVARLAEQRADPRNYPRGYIFPGGLFDKADFIRGFWDGFNGANP